MGSLGSSGSVASVPSGFVAPAAQLPKSLAHVVVVVVLPNLSYAVAVSTRVGQPSSGSTSVLLSTKRELMPPNVLAGTYSNLVVCVTDPVPPVAVVTVRVGCPSFVACVVS